MILSLHKKRVFKIRVKIPTYRGFRGNLDSLVNPKDHSMNLVPGLLILFLFL